MGYVNPLEGSELVAHCDEAWIPKIVVRFRTGLQICSPPKNMVSKDKQPTITMNSEVKPLFEFADLFQFQTLSMVCHNNC